MRIPGRTPRLLPAGGTALLFAVLLSLTIQPRLDGGDPAPTRIQTVLAQLPLSFEANRGQTDPRVDFLSRGPGYTLFLTPGEAVLVLPNAAARHVLRMKLAGALPAPDADGLEAQPGRGHYFIGNDPGRWRTDVPTYARVRYRGVYPGIDLVYYGNQRQLEYDFVIAPGADPGAIAIGFEGARRLSVIGGELIIATDGGQVRLREPAIYQQVAGVRRRVAGGYALKGPRTVGFEIGAYDRNTPLIIDPVLVYSTYLGGSGTDQGFAIAVDSAGDVYVTGVTMSADFPTTGGAVQTAFGGSQDVFVTRVNAAGTALVYSTYLGGSGADLALGIAVDAAGDAYVTGTTTSATFPATVGALQTAFGGTQDTFVTKLNAAGALAYSTYLGGIGGDGARAIAVDSSGDAFVTGFTNSINFPTTGGVVQATYGGVQDAFVTRLNATGTALVYSTYLGGSGADNGWDIAVNAAGDASVTGITASTNFPTTSGVVRTTFGGSQDAFVTRLNAAGSALIYSTYLGGSGTDQGIGIALNSAGDAFVTGTTFSANFPVTGGAVQTAFGGSQDVFVARLNATATALVYSTYLGGSGIDQGWGIAVNGAGDAHVVGVTTSANFPIAGSAIQTTLNGAGDALVARLNAAGAALVYSTYLGGSASETARGIALDSAGDAVVTGFTASSDFPTAGGPFQSTSGGGSDIFVAKLSPILATTTTLTSSANPSMVGQSVTFTATVSPSAATGTVTFRNGTTVLGTATLASGQAAVSSSALALGSHSITAEYSGSPSFTPSAGSLTQQVTYGICPLYDQTRSVKSGAVFPIKVALCDANGTNLSSASVVLHATAVTMISGFSGEPDAPGNANPDNDFRHDGSLGGYIFNLSTQGLAGGTYSLQFTVTGDPVTHAVGFGVK